MEEDILILEKPRRRSRWAALVWFVLGAATASGVIFAICMWQTVQRILKEPYVVWQTAEMIVEYMEKHQNRWPTSWKDLESCSGPYPSNTGFSIEELQQRVVVDFNADPVRLSKAELTESTGDDYQPPFRVIWLRNGRTYYVTGSEPNRIILQYLKLGRMRPR